MQMAQSLNTFTLIVNTNICDFVAVIDSEIESIGRYTQSFISFVLLFTSCSFPTLTPLSTWSLVFLFSLLNPAKCICYRNPITFPVSLLSCASCYDFIGSCYSAVNYSLSAKLE